MVVRGCDISFTGDVANFVTTLACKLPAFVIGSGMEMTFGGVIDMTTGDAKVFVSSDVSSSSSPSTSSVSLNLAGFFLTLPDLVTG
ncbi:hypothetical protein KUTeg_015978 [Tegillarca granosa]|uniref:Uncharacterized protein n=1 Tax=Tegillarca granosa TaxID=220873 RepID=A0ABQ9EJI4_TEGGR|nr:hypothetical protein KUTeg_015978 [Tegillarca granosa]